MSEATSYTKLAERDLEDFEGDLKRYKASNRRSVWFSAFALIFLLLAACTVCSAAILLFQ